MKDTLENGYLVGPTKQKMEMTQIDKIRGESRCHRNKKNQQELPQAVILKQAKGKGFSHSFNKSNITLISKPEKDIKKERIIDQYL